ncbi:MAG: MFS transporter [Microbacterium sp.]
MTADSAGDGAERSRWGATPVALAIVVVLNGLDTSKFNVALPTLAVEAGASPAQQQLMIVGFSLAVGLTLVPLGRAGDLGHRRTIMLVGIGLSLGSAAVGALAPSAEMIVVARIVQGVAGGCIMPQVFGLLQATTSPQRRAAVLGGVSALMSIAVGVGPIVGGLTIEALPAGWGWRMLFAANVPVLAAVLVLLLRALPRDAAGLRPAAAFDVRGIAVLSTTVLLCVVPPLAVTAGLPGGSLWWWLLLLLPPLVAILASVERRAERHGNRQPLVPPRLLRLAALRNGIVYGGLFFTAVPSLFLALSIQLQTVTGYGPLGAGALVGCWALASGLGALLASRVAARRRRGWLVAATGVCAGATIGAPAFAEFAGGAAGTVGVASMMLAGGAAGGLCFALNQILAFDAVPRDDGGAAGSLLQLSQRVGGTIGGAVVMLIGYSGVPRSWMFAGMGMATLFAGAAVAAARTKRPVTPDAVSTTLKGAST